MTQAIDAAVKTLESLICDHGGTLAAGADHPIAAQARAALALVQAEQAKTQGMVMVPKQMNQAMRDVTEQDDWEWADLLAAAEAITLEEYDAIASQKETPGTVHSKERE